MDSNNSSLFFNISCPKPGIADIPPLRLFIGHYIFPWLLIIGITGNILNLRVLISRGMRTKTNALLSAMAVSDLGFLLLMLPTELRVFESVATQNWYRSFIAHHKMTLTFAINWMATASTWMALAVTAERVFAIKMPLHAKFYWKKKRIAILIFTVFLITLLLHLYNFFWFRVSVQAQYCTNGDFAFNAYVLNLLGPNETAYTYVQASHIFVPHLSITFPFFVLFILNAFLLYYLHQNRRAMADATSAPQLRQNELKVGLMVATIVFTFIICSAPSVALYIYDAIVTFARRTSSRPSMWYTSTWYILSTLSNCLVVLGKASNFILYCSASSHFRRRLARLFCKRYSGPARASSSRASTSQRRTTLSSLFVTALNNHHHHHHQRTSMDACCALAAGVCPNDRRTSSKSNDSIELADKTHKLKVPISIDRRRRNSTQQTTKLQHPTLYSQNTRASLLADHRRFSSPDQKPS